MALVNGAVLDEHVLGGHADAAAGRVEAGLDAEAVVAGVHDAAGHVHAPAGVDVEGVGVLRPAIIEDLHVAQGHVLAEPGMEGPVGRVAEGDALDEHAAALEQAQQARALEKAIGLVGGGIERAGGGEGLGGGGAVERGLAGPPLVLLGVEHAA